MNQWLLRPGLRFILASGSPRRYELLQNNLGVIPEVIPSTFVEDLDKNRFATPSEYCSETARCKALEVAERVLNNASSAVNESFVIVGADTVVVENNRILEKPKSDEAAVKMLHSLSNLTHHVITGVTLVAGCTPSQSNETIGGIPVRVVSFNESTEVRFAELDDAVVRAYVETGEPLDKAGAYGIQGKGAQLVEGISGCYFNVVGLPVRRLVVELERLLS